MEGNEAVKALGIFNSGLLGGFELAGQLTKPTMYALGGPDDIAYGNVSFWVFFFFFFAVAGKTTTC
jgi:hypothetical protein